MNRKDGHREAISIQGLHIIEQRKTQTKEGGKREKVLKKRRKEKRPSSGMKKVTCGEK